MATVHLVLQGKGGVGKSLAAALIAQHRRGQGRRLLCIDADPLNRTLSGYRSFADDLFELDLMCEEGIAPAAFDRMMDRIADHDGDVVVDTGASAFLPLSLYIVENDAAAALQDLGHQVTVHTVVTGGQAMADTLNGFEAIVEQFPEGIEVVVWVNEFFGAVERDGKAFTELAAYQRLRSRVHGMVTIRQGSELFARDFKALLEARQTFAEALDDTSHAWMSRVRMKKIRDGIFDQLDVVLGMGGSQGDTNSKGEVNGAD